MKISALKQMVRDAVRAEMKQMEKRLEESFERKLNEALQRGPTPTLNEEAETAEAPASNLAELRARFRGSQSSAGDDAYAGLGRPTGGSPADDPTAIKPRPTSGPKPKNKRGTTSDGEHYASGENILEWFGNEKDTQALSEHEQALARGEKIDKYVNQIIGKKRL